MIILSFDLQVWPWPSTCLNKIFKYCARLFWNPCMNVEVMAQTSSINDHFVIWPSSVTFLNKCFKWTTMPNYFEIHENNVEVMAQRSSIYDHFIIWPSSVTLTFNLPEKMFQKALLLLKENNCAKLFWNQCNNVEVMARQAQFMTILSFVLQV